MSFIGKKHTDRLSKYMKKLTIDLTDYWMEKIYIKGLGKEEFDTSVLISQNEKIKKYIHELETIGSRKGATNSIKHFISKNDFDKYYGQIMRKYNDKYKNKRIYALPERIDKFIKLSEYPKVMNRHKTNNVKYLVASCYRYLPALRGQDFYDTRLSENDGYTGNVLNVNTWKMTIRLHKTSSYNGIKKINIPTQLQEIINNWILDKGLSYGDYLLGRKYVRSSFTKIVNRTFGNSVGVNDLRRGYISEVLNYLREYTPENILLRKKMAYIVGHGLATQELIYGNHRQIKGLKYSSKTYMEGIIELLKTASIYYRDD